MVNSCVAVHTPFGALYADNTYVCMCVCMKMTVELHNKKTFYSKKKAENRKDVYKGKIQIKTGARQFRYNQATLQSPFKGG